MNKIEITGTIQSITKVYNSIVPPDTTGFHILVDSEKDPFSIFVIYTGESESLKEGTEVTVTGSLAKYDNFFINVDSICKKETHCKYCGEVIPKGHYCCNSCWKEFEE